MSARSPKPAPPLSKRRAENLALHKAALATLRAERDALKATLAVECESSTAARVEASQFFAGLSAERDRLRDALAEANALIAWQDRRLNERDFDAARHQEAFLAQALRLGDLEKLQRARERDAFCAHRSSPVVRPDAAAAPEAAFGDAPASVFVREGTPAWEAWLARVGEMPRIKSAEGLGCWKPTLFPPLRNGAVRPHDERPS